MDHSGLNLSQRIGSGQSLTALKSPAVRYAVIVFVATRLILSLWAILVLAVRPLPAEPDEVLRPYLGESRLAEGASGVLLGPWQRFDTQHYLRIARQGYTAQEDSVFAPAYPLSIRAGAWLLGSVGFADERYLLSGILVSNLAFVIALILLFQMVEYELDSQSARRSIIYLAIFPASFFLVAGYTESLFLALAIGAIGASRRGRFWIAGLVALVAALTRLNGWVLVVPLAYEYWCQKKFNYSQLRVESMAIVLPMLGFVAFVLWRWTVGMPSLSEVYERFWFQQVGIPGTDLVIALQRIISGEGAFTLYFDFICILLLLVSTLLVFRRLAPTYGIYSLILLLFMLLPTSTAKPLFSTSRYALAFFPTFMVLGQAGTNPWLNRIIVYASAGLLLYFSGQFFMWGWVA